MYECENLYTLTCDFIIFLLSNFGIFNNFRKFSIAICLSIDYTNNCRLEFEDNSF